jgi:hypothetical protein
MSSVPAISYVTVYILLSDFLRVSLIIDARPRVLVETLSNTALWKSRHKTVDASDMKISHDCKWTQNLIPISRPF